MKKIIIATLFILTFSLVRAQDAHEFSWGPYLQLKAGVNGGNIPEGRKNAVLFNGVPDFGLSIYYPLGEFYDIGLMADLGMSTYAFGQKDVINAVQYDLKFSYLTFAPYFYFQGFMAGLALGYPLMADYGAEIDTKHVAFMAELRLSGMYPLYMDESGSLNAVLHAGYMLTGVYEDFPVDDALKEIIPALPPQVHTNKYNPRVISISLGINYLFNMEYFANLFGAE